MKKFLLKLLNRNVTFSHFSIAVFILAIILTLPILNPLAHFAVFFGIIIGGHFLEKHLKKIW